MGGVAIIGSLLFLGGAALIGYARLGFGDAHAAPMTTYTGLVFMGIGALVFLARWAQENMNPR